MLLEITDSFWVNIDKILFIVKDKATDEWHLHFNDNIRAGHLILTDDDMAKFRESMAKAHSYDDALVPFAPSTCL